MGLWPAPCAAVLGAALPLLAFMILCYLGGAGVLTCGLWSAAVPALPCPFG